jgi:hypothetical protein
MVPCLKDYYPPPQYLNLEQEAFSQDGNLSTALQSMRNERFSCLILVYHTAEVTALSSILPLGFTVRRSMIFEPRLGL